MLGYGLFTITRAGCFGAMWEETGSAGREQTGQTQPPGPSQGRTGDLPSPCSCATSWKQAGRHVFGRSQAATREQLLATYAAVIGAVVLARAALIRVPAITTSKLPREEVVRAALGEEARAELPHQALRLQQAPPARCKGSAVGGMLMDLVDGASAFSPTVDNL
jgi:hypothetical protein